MWSGIRLTFLKLTEANIFATHTADSLGSFWMATYSERMASVGALLNLVLHRIADDREKSDDLYTTTTEQLRDLAEWLAMSGLMSHTRLYFDDNDSSFFERALPILENKGLHEIVLAVPVSSIGQPGRGSLEQLMEADGLGIRIAAHGMTHVPLASYEADELLSTPSGGKYEITEVPPNSPLTENQVLFQLVEAKEHLRRFSPSEFVLPFGCFNSTTVAINERHVLFEFLGTSDAGLDFGQVLRPRRLVTATTTPTTIEAELTEQLGGDGP
jgi:peptidoglycan/xylan/chitin deacetylase (PgdA/CDA1 family)